MKSDHTAERLSPASDGWGGGKTFFFVAEFSRPFDAAGVDVDGKRLAGKQGKRQANQGQLRFQAKPANEPLMSRSACPAVSVEGARNNLHAEIPGWDFDARRHGRQQAWQRRLRGSTPIRQRRRPRDVLHRALSHASVRQRLFSDVDGQFRGPDGKVHLAKGFSITTPFSLVGHVPRGTSAADAHAARARERLRQHDAGALQHLRPAHAARLAARPATKPGA